MSQLEWHKFTDSSGNMGQQAKSEDGVSYTIERNYSLKEEQFNLWVNHPEDGLNLKYFSSMADAKKWCEG